VKLRVRFAKRGKVRFTSHRDTARIWERALRRAGVPVAYSHGFSPRPRLSFGLALPTGYQSDGEYLDVQILAGRWTGEGLALVGPHDGRVLGVDELPRVLADALPSGFDVDAVAVIEDRVESLQEMVTACTWRFTIRDIDEATARAAVVDLLAAPTVPVEREHKGRTVVDDLRPAVEELTVIEAVEHGVELEATLPAKPRVVRPAELVTALAPGHELGVATRRHQWIERDGIRREPLAIGCSTTGDARVAQAVGVPGRDVVGAPHVGARAS
jgi:radical SAM-linked protein